MILILFNEYFHSDVELISKLIRIQWKPDI